MQSPPPTSWGRTSGSALMKTHARVVIVGGGVVGVSILYHLTKKGWTDAVLLEKMDLTHGSTWHAAGLLPLFNMSYSIGQLHKYSVDLYQQLEAETGQAVGFHKTGNLRLATNRDRMDEYYKYCGTANTIGVPFKVITPAQVKELWPLCNTDGLVGALYRHDGAGQGRTHARRRDLPPDQGHRHRAETERRMAGEDRQGRHLLRARRHR